MAQEIAQDTESSVQEPSADSTIASEIVVSGTRVIRDGYKAATPTSVIGAEEIARTSPSNIADFVNQLPSVSGSTSPRANVASVSAGQVGINALNLRNLGANRTLILLNGRRVAASNIAGLVDINTIPQALVKRIDVVTGGASAGWGSDAVTGIVNFVLDTDYTGLKGSVQGGVTTYGDDKSFNVSLTGGTKFADGRGHFMLSGEIAHNDGINGIGKRKWYNAAKLFPNPAYTPDNGQPQLLNLPHVGIATAAPGGLITSGPLRGTYFGPGGVPTQFNYGPIVSGNFMVGGDWQYTDYGAQHDLDPRSNRQSIFGRLSYAIADRIELFAQGSYNRAAYHESPLTQFNLGNITIQPDNAFIPEAISAQITAPFKLGTLNEDLGPTIATTERSSTVGVIGARGDFDAFDTNWSWDIYGQRTINRIYTDFFTTIKTKYAEAIDSVRNEDGAIVCRSTLTNPGNGCAPYNIFGTGVVSQAARNYVSGTSLGRTRITQNVFAGTLRGEPFNTWAGPVSIATGVEHRREAVSGKSDELSLTRSYFAGNFIPTFGSYHVTEGFFEAVVPLAADAPFAKTLDLNGAVRATDYSTSGFVTTWKLGLTYSPVEDLTFRATRSRDIRAPNLQELFAAGVNNTTVVNDPFRNGEPATITQTVQGNFGLAPEKADTFGIGAVFQPTFLPGFAASVDYYDIKIKGAITTVNAPSVLQACAAGDATLCSQIVRGAATPGDALPPQITQIFVLPVNASKLKARGLDFEASYRREAFGGDISLRMMATRFLENSNSVDGIDTVGTNGTNGTLRNSLPKWQYQATVAYNRDPISFSLTARGFSSGVYNTSYVECISNCPSGVTTINDNYLPGATYFDASIKVKLPANIEAFLAVDNIANKDPAQMAFGPSLGAAPLSINPLLYDILGRTFRAGFRFKM